MQRKTWQKNWSLKWETHVYNERRKKSAVPWDLPITDASKPRINQSLELWENYFLREQPVVDLNNKNRIIKHGSDLSRDWLEQNIIQGRA